MLYEFSLPTKADKVPSDPDWLHEVKCDGYRMMLIREHDRVRLISRGGYDLTRHFPLVVEAALKARGEWPSAWNCDGRQWVATAEVPGFRARILGVRSRRRMALCLLF